MRALFASFDFQTSRRDCQQDVRGHSYSESHVFFEKAQRRHCFPFDRCKETTENFGIPANVFLPLLEAGI